MALEIQEQLVMLIRQAERNLRRANEAARTSRRVGDVVGLDRAAARKATKRQRERALARRDHYRDLLVVLRSIGDALAFIFIDKYEIKPMAFKESPGFLTGKAGLRAELRILRSVFKWGGLAILNDLTNCLRYADLTLITADGFSLFEVKSGNATSERIERQLGKIRAITDYLRTDTAVGLYGLPGTTYRKAPPRDEVNHMQELNSLIAEAHLKGLAWTQVEPGLRYLVSTRVPTEGEVKDLGSGLQRPILVTVNEAKLQPRGHFPFTLSIRDPGAVVRFFYGDFVVVVAVDGQELSQAFERRGWTLEATWGGDYPLRIHRLHKAEPVEVGLSRHWFERLFMEFTSLEWWVEASCDVHVPDGVAQDAR